MSPDSKSKSEMARARWRRWSLLPLAALVAGTCLIETIRVQAAGDEARLLADAQRAFKPLPKEFSGKLLGLRFYYFFATFNRSQISGKHRPT